jgi:hypothetical protein
VTGIKDYFKSNEAVFRHGFQLFFLQILNYGVICFSYRVLAENNKPATVITDLIYSYMGFVIFKKIQSSTNTRIEKVMYSIGSAIGTLVGMLASDLMDKILHHVR